MIIYIGIGIVWVLVAGLLFLKRHIKYKRKPWLLARRHDGLISFTDKEVYWMTWFWPVTMILAIMFILLCLLARVIRND